MNRKLFFILTLVSFLAFISNAQVINTIAGVGLYRYGGDGGPAIDAELYGPFGITVSKKGDIYITTFEDSRIRKIDASTGIITTIAGIGSYGYNGDGILATSAQLRKPYGLAVDTDENVYVSDWLNARIRKIDKATGIITTIAGTGSKGYNGDGILAKDAKLWDPTGLVLDSAGNIYISDEGNYRIRRIDKNTNIITTIAGTGVAGYNGDDILATDAQLHWPEALTLDREGNIYFFDDSNYRERKITIKTGKISTLAGTGTRGYSGDGGLAINSDLEDSEGIAVDKAGNLYLADSRRGRIRKVDISNGIITTIAGDGTYGYAGDGGAAINAKFAYIEGIAIDTSDNLYVTDVGNGRIRKITEISVITNNEQLQTSLLSAYPNPFHNNISFICSKSIDKLFIFNAFGQIVYEKANTNCGEFIELNSLPNGIYWVKTEGDDKMAMRIVKQ